MIDTGGGGFSGSSAATAGDISGSNSLSFENISGPVRSDNTTLMIIAGAALLYFLIIKRK